MTNKHILLVVYIGINTFMCPPSKHSDDASSTIDIERVLPELLMEDELLNATFSYRLKKSKDPAISWAKDKDDYPPLSASKALLLAQNTKELLSLGADHRYRLHLERLSLKPFRYVSTRALNYDGWIWVARYELDSVDDLTLMGQPLFLDIPVLMTGEVPLSEKNGGAIKNVKVGALAKSRVIHPSGDQIEYGMILRGFNALYDPYTIKSRIDYTDLRDHPRWKLEDENPPLAPKRVLAQANGVVDRIRREISAPSGDVEFYQLSLVPIHDRWIWVAEYYLDNHDEDAHNILSIPIFLNGKASAIEITKEDDSRGGG